MAAPFLAVVPAWNEAGTVGETVREIHAGLPEATILVVDDGSTDATAEEARSAGATVVSLPFNLGVGGAMRTGFRYAVQHGFDTVVQIDVDGQHDPAEVPGLLAELTGADLVIGARFAGRGDYEAEFLRRLAMRVLARAVSTLTRTRLTDTTSGFRASGPRAVALFAEDYPAEYLGDTVESTIIAAKAGLTITQRPVRMRTRRGGTPSQSPLRLVVFLARAMLVVFLAGFRARPKGPR